MAWCAGGDDDTGIDGQRRGAAVVGRLVDVGPQDPAAADGVAAAAVCAPWRDADVDVAVRSEQCDLARHPRRVADVMEALAHRAGLAGVAVAQLEQTAGRLAGTEHR